MMAPPRDSQVFLASAVGFLASLWAHMLRPVASTLAARGAGRIEDGSTRQTVRRACDDVAPRCSVAVARQVHLKLRVAVAAVYVDMPYMDRTGRAGSDQMLVGLSTHTNREAVAASVYVGLTGQCDPGTQLPSAVMSQMSLLKS